MQLIDPKESRLYFLDDFQSRELWAKGYLTVFANGSDSISYKRMDELTPAVPSEDIHE